MILVNILINSNLKEAMKCILVVAAFAVACSFKESNDVIHEMTVVPKFVIGDTVSLISLEFTFISKDEMSVIFDHDALSIETYKTEQTDSANDLVDVIAASRSMRHPQFVIENKKHQRRFFYDAVFFEDELYYPRNVFTLDRTVDTLRSHQGQPAKTNSVYIDVNRFKIDSYDDSVRLFYIYRASSEEKKIGFRDEIFQSNWFSLEPIDEKN
jgi:hypothetical protein